MEKDEREFFWKVLQDCWAQDPHARPPIHTVVEKLGNLRGILFERIQGNSHSFLKLMRSRGNVNNE